MGDVWQDQHNMAALLLYRQPGHEHYSLVSRGFYSWWCTHGDGAHVDGRLVLW